MITLISVCLGMLSIHPGLAVVFVVVALPSFLITWSRVDERETQGKLTTAREKVATFAVAFGLVALVCVAAVGAFFVTCATAILSDLDSASKGRGFLAILVSATVGISVLGGTVFAAMKIWPFRD